VARRRRREEEELKRPERDRHGGDGLARLPAEQRSGVLEELQRATGNQAIQRVLAGGQLQRDTATVTRPGKAATPRAAEWVLSLDGAAVPARAVTGGGISAEVIQHHDPGGGVQKRVGALRYDPVVLELGLGTGKGLFDWVAAAVAANFEPKHPILQRVDPATGAENARMELTDALVTGFALPRLDATDTAPAWLTVTLTPEQTKARGGDGAKAVTTGALDPLDPSTAQLEISGIGRLGELKSIAAWSFQSATKRSTEPHGTIAPARGDLGNLVVTLAEGQKSAKSIAALDEWVEDFLVLGNSDRPERRMAALTVSSKGGRKLELTFWGVGIFSADRLAGSRRYGLYVERAELKVS
jgi:phage tail-like protein